MPPHEKMYRNVDSHLSMNNVVARPTSPSDPGSLPPHDTSTATMFPVILKFEEVVYIVRAGGYAKEKTILNGVTGMACPGEMLAMLGPSGSGKTTLLTALGGRLPAGHRLSGKITYNNHSFSGAMRRRTGFVSQDDVLYPHLTVTETLVFTALLRLPRTLTPVEKAQRAGRVIAELGLTRVAHSVVGGPLVRGISGGERRRVSIGQEMLLNPSLLLLDEPTSGLDSTNAQRIVATLRRLAADGRRAVVTTIHQPSNRMYGMFDKVLLLSDGRSIYHGRAADAVGYFASIGFAPAAAVAVNPAELLLDLANGFGPESKHGKYDENEDCEPERKVVKEQLFSAYHREIATKLKAELSSAKTTADSHHNGSAYSSSRMDIWSTSWLDQFIVLLRRSIKERRHETLNKLRIFQVLSVAIIGGLLWWRTSPSQIQNKINLVFFFSVFWGFFSLHSAVYTFPQEGPMLLKERASGMYRLSSYFMALTAGDLPMEIALPTAFTAIIYWMGGLDPHPTSFLLYLLVVLYNVLVAQSLGLAFGAILMDVKQASTVASVTTLTFLMAGGYYVQHIPSYIVWLKHLSYSFHTFKLLLTIQFRPNDTYECAPGESCPAVEFPAIKSVGLDHIWLDVGILGFMLVGYRLLAYWALHRLQRSR